MAVLDLAKADGGRMIFARPSKSMVPWTTEVRHAMQPCSRHQHSGASMQCFCWSSRECHLSLLIS